VKSEVLDIRKKVVVGREINIRKKIRKERKREECR